MHPIFLRLGPLTLHGYGVMLAVAVLTALWLAQRRAKSAGLDPERVFSLGIYMVLVAIIVAKAWLVIPYWGYYAANPRRLLDLSNLQFAGGFYIGFGAAFVVALLYARRARMQFLRLADVYSAPLALGLAIARLGCFSAGCCWGKPTERAWGVIFTDSYAHDLVGVPLGMRLHPTQLYESAAALAIFLVILWLGARQRFAGQIFAAFVILYGLTRGVIEFFRGDPDRIMLFGDTLSSFQLISLGLVVLGAWLWWRGSAQPSR